jgi:hypothetical protein
MPPKYDFQWVQQILIMSRSCGLALRSPIPPSLFQDPMFCSSANLLPRTLPPCAHRKNPQSKSIQWERGVHDRRAKNLRFIFVPSPADSLRFVVRVRNHDRCAADSDRLQVLKLV